MTGRIVTNPSSGLPEVHCRNQGAELVVGEAAVPLKSLDFGLAEESLKRIVLPFDEDVPLSVQLVSFTCGGFSVSWSCNNLVLDGHSVAKLARIWSELARSGTATDVGVPTTDNRAILRPRDPPSYSDAVNEMFTPYDHRHQVNVLTAEDSFVDKLYYVEAQDLERLREMASTESQRASRVQALSAYLWKSMAALVAASKRVSNSNASCCMGYWVDARFRVTSPKLRAAMRNYSDFGFGHAAIAMPTWASERLCSGNLVVTTHPGDNGSWLISAYLWPRLAAALEPDEMRIQASHGRVSWCLGSYQEYLYIKAAGFSVKYLRCP